MIRKIIKKLTSAYRHRCFWKVQADNIVIGPEVDKNFHIGCPERLQVGYRTVLNGDLLINAKGG